MNGCEYAKIMFVCLFACLLVICDADVRNANWHAMDENMYEKSKKFKLV